MAQQQIDRLEAEIDAMNGTLAPLDQFHSARRHRGKRLRPFRANRRPARRARLAQALQAEALNPLTLAYLNRLSDHLFVLARRLNDNGARDVLCGRTRPARATARRLARLAN